MVEPEEDIEQPAGKVLHIEINEPRIGAHLAFDLVGGDGDNGTLYCCNEETWRWVKFVCDDDVLRRVRPARTGDEDMRYDS